MPTHPKRKWGPGRPQKLPITLRIIAKELKKLNHHARATKHTLTYTRHANRDKGHNWKSTTIWLTNEELNINHTIAGHFDKTIIPRINRILTQQVGWSHEIVENQLQRIIKGHNTHNLTDPTTNLQQITQEIHQWLTTP